MINLFSFIKNKPIYLQLKDRSIFDLDNEDLHKSVIMIITDCIKHFETDGSMYHVPMVFVSKMSASFIVIVSKLLYCQAIFAVRTDVKH